MKKECKIVQDLLPNYLEKVTNPETNEFIEEHLKSCEECKKTYSSMQYDMNVEKIDTKEEVKYMKKFKKQLRILRNILLVIIVVFVIVVTRKAIILASLGNKLNRVYDPNNYKIVWNEEGTGGEFRDLNNYHLKSIGYSKGDIMIKEVYNKDVISLSYFEIYDVESKESKVKWTYYQNGLDEVCIEEVHGTKKVVNFALAVGGIKTTADMSTFGIFGLKEYFRLLVLADIHKVNLNGKECYAVKIDNNEDYIDIEAGTVLKSVYNDGNETWNYYYEFGTVTDEDIKRPEIQET